MSTERQRKEGRRTTKGTKGEVHEEDTGKQMRKDRLRLEYVQTSETGTVGIIFPPEKRGFRDHRCGLPKVFSHSVYCSPTMLMVTQ